MANVHPRLGAIKDPEDPRDFPMKAVLRTTTDLPQVCDYEKNQSLIKDQGNRGACVAFSSTAVKEFQEAKQRKFKVMFDFSEEWLYDQIMVPGGGAYIRDAFKTLTEVGTPREKFMPYNYSKSDDDERTFKPSKAAVTNAKYYKAQSYARLMNIDMMLQSLVVNGPFVVGVDWQSNWFNPTEKDPQGYPILRSGGSGSAGGHALAIVGFDQQRQLFKFKNSWSSRWGNKGFAYFHYDVMKNNLMDAWSVLDVTKPQIDMKALQQLQVKRVDLSEELGLE